MIPPPLPPVFVLLCPGGVDMITLLPPVFVLLCPGGVDILE
jgi:hypothetical protein